jgi:hypothetical protein
MMDELDPEARRVLAHVRAARTPSEVDQARVAQRLSVALGAAALAAPSAAVAAPAKLVKPTLFALKWWLSGGVLLVAALGGYAASSVPTAKREAAVQVASRNASPLPQGEGQGEGPPKLTPPILDPIAPEPTAPVQPLVATTPHRKHVPAAPGALNDELTLLHRAQSAWRAGDAASAWRALRQHRQHFPHSSLSVERDGLLVLTLCELGHKAEARELARQLLARAPQAPLRGSIEQSCALK